MTNWREVRSSWTPPAVSRWAAGRHSAGRNTFAEFDGSWLEASAAVSGYQDHSILDRVVAATHAVESGQAAMERDSVLFAERDVNWPLLAVLMQSAALDGRLSVLDFGGSLGSTYRQHRPELDRLPDVTWSVVEQANFVEAGRKDFQTDRLRFFASPSECVAATRPNVVVLASSLQYLQQPHALLRDLLARGPRSVVIDRTPFSDDGADHLCIQRVPESIYPAQYPMWVLSRQHLLDELPAGWTVQGEYDSGHGTVQTDRGLGFTWAGIVLERS